jgi:DNA gyrase subunit A
MKLKPGDQVVSADVVADDHLLLTITDAGFGKRTDPGQFTRQGRGGQGIRAMRLHADKGRVVAAEMVTDDDELFLVNDSGVTIRLPVESISTQGRDATGVRVMNLDDDTKVVAAARVPFVEGDDEVDDEDESGAESSGESDDTTEIVSSDDPDSPDINENGSDTAE